MHKKFEIRLTEILRLEIINLKKVLLNDQTDLNLTPPLNLKLGKKVGLCTGIFKIFVNYLLPPFTAFLSCTYITLLM